MKKQSTMDTEMVKERPLSEIAPDPHQPRKTFDLAPILATFDSGSASIWEPITIRLTKPGEKNPDGSARTEPFTIVEGEQRYQAAKLHGMATIPTLPPVDLDGDALLLRQIASGSTKKPLLPLEVADAVARLKNKRKLGEIAKQCGFSSANRVHQVLALTNLSPECRDKLASGAISEPVARAISTAGDHAKQTQCLNDVLRLDLGHNPRKVATFIGHRYHLALVPESAGFNPDDSSLPGGACGRCPKNTASQRSLGIFEDDATDARCTDVRCFEGKRAAYWTRAKESYLERRIRVIEGDEALRLFPYPTTLAPTDPMLVWLHESVVHNDNTTTYAAILGTAEPSTVVYAHGVMHECIDRRRLVALLRKGGFDALANNEQDFLDDVDAEDAAKTDREEHGAADDSADKTSTAVGKNGNYEAVVAAIRAEIKQRVKRADKAAWRGVCAILVPMRHRLALDTFCGARDIPANIESATEWFDSSERTELELAHAALELLVGTDGSLLSALPPAATVDSEACDTIVAFMRGNMRTLASREDLDAEDIVPSDSLDAHIESLVDAGRVVVVDENLWKLAPSEVDGKKKRKGR